MYKYLIFILLIATACSEKIVTYLNNNVDYGTINTYRLVSIRMDRAKITSEHNEVLDVLRTSIVDELKKRDYQESAIDPDMTIRYELNSSQRTEISNNTIFNPLAFQSPLITERTINESLLLVEMLNEKGQLIWQSSYDLKQSKGDKKTRELLRNAVVKAFSTYPYRAGRNEPDFFTNDNEQ